MSFRRLTRNALASVSQVCVSTVLLVALYWLFREFLTTEEIGLWSLVLAAAAVGRLSDFGFGGAVMFFVASDVGRTDWQMAARTIGSACIFVGAAAAIVCVGLFLPFKYVLLRLVPEDHVAGALHLLPFALVSLTFSTVGGVFLGALDALQRTDLRATSQVGGSLCQFLVAYVLLPKQGFACLGYVQVIQAFVTLALASLFTRSCVPHSSGQWLKWETGRIKELAKYGGGLQLAALGQLFFDPCVKGLLTAFGGLSLTGYYEIANRTVLQLRGIIVSAYNVLVPYIGGRLAGGSDSKGEIVQFYSRAYRLLFAVALPYYAVAAAAIPIGVVLWAGHMERSLMLVCILCLLGWLNNTLVASAYFMFLAAGTVRWTVWSQVIIGILNVLLSSLAGYFFGGFGVLVGSVAALSIGSFVLPWAFHREYQIAHSMLLPKESIPMAAASAACGVAAIVYASASGEQFDSNVSVSIFVMSLLLLGGLVCRHPLTREILVRLSKRKPNVAV